jgi:hypothetical protein
MSLLAVEKPVTGAVSVLPAYDSTKWNLGSLIQQRTDVSPNFIGPSTIGLGRPVETIAAIPGIFPHVIPWSSTTHWVFLSDNIAAAVTRRIQVYENNLSTSLLTFKGYITLTYPAATVHTIRGFRVLYSLHTAGTVGVSGTTVTGTGTTWDTDRASVGNRIGFGSSDPTQITTWYEIQSFTGDGTITLTTSAGTISAGTAYVIEDLSVATVTTNITTTNGGLFVAKGLRYELFTTGGTTIPAATTLDRTRSVCWLADAATVTNTVGAGLALGAETNKQTRYAYVLDVAGKIYKYNLRGALSLTAGKDTTAINLVTGVQAVTGVMSQSNNGRIRTLNHGPGAGVVSLYFVTTTRIYRCADSAITNGSITWQSDVMTEVPPGGISTYAATAALASVEASVSLDRLIVVSSGAAGTRHYLTQYRTDGGQMDHIWSIDSKFTPQASASQNIPNATIDIAVAPTIWEEAGILYVSTTGTTAVTNFLYSLPIGADWNYIGTTNQVAISPAISTPNCDKFIRAYWTESQNLGSYMMGAGTEPMRVSYRTSNITVDSTSGWTILPDDGTLNVTGASAIQFRYEFKILNGFCIPARVTNTAVLYNSIDTDSHWQSSVGKSDVNTPRFAWRFATAYGGTVPNLRIRLYDAVTGGLLIDDNTSAPTGTFEKSTNSGSTWTAYNTTDKGNETTYIRYTPASIGSGINVRPLLSLL